jgi:hypothetical protein
MHRPLFTVEADAKHQLVIVSLEGVVTDLKLTPDYAEAIGKRLSKAAESLRTEAKPLDGALVEA